MDALRIFAIVVVGGTILFSYDTRSQEVSDLQRDASQFSYFQLGNHVPPKSGYRNYAGSRTVIDQSIGLPLEIDPANGEHMYCNTQVSGFNKDGVLRGKSNHIKNYTFPWTSTFCEKRWNGRQATRACGPTSPQSHQGTDCRPPKPIADFYWMTAVEDAEIITARRNLIEMVGNRSKILWKYRHGGAPSVKKGDMVTKGTRLARVTDLSSTPIHLHLESERAAGNDLDNLPALIVAYQKALGNQTQIKGGELVYDARFEVAHGVIASSCGASENASVLQVSVSALGKQSLWCHNGSIMRLAERGDERSFIYHRPSSPGLTAAIASDAVLVQGRVQNDTFRGFARHYSTRCGNRTFEVSGKWPASSKVVTLEGTRTQFIHNCAARSREEILTFGWMREFTPQADGDRKSLTEVTKNWGAITMPTADRSRWLPYVKDWPGLAKSGEVADSKGGVIPAFETDEAGVGLWWYWLVVRKGYGEIGSPTFQELAHGIAGDNAADSAITVYLKQYLKLAPKYFQRPIESHEKISLSSPDDRWALAQTMFHHESGRPPLITRDTFDRGISYGSDVLNGEYKGAQAYVSQVNAPVVEQAQPIQPTPEEGVALAVDKLKQENHRLAKQVQEISEKILRIQEIVK